MKDRYEHWYTNYDPSRPLAAPFLSIKQTQIRDLEDLVLQDMAKAGSESEKLEILDSYSLACQRKYRNELSCTLMDTGKNLFATLIGPFLQANIPAPQPPYHPTVGRIS